MLFTEDNFGVLLVWGSLFITGNLELICIGPLTNIAQVIAADHNFGDKIKHCYIMGGNFRGKYLNLFLHNGRLTLLCMPDSI